MIRDFDQLVSAVLEHPVRRRAAVAGAHDAHTLEAVLQAQGQGLIQPLLVGERSGVEAGLRALDADPAAFCILDSGDENPGAVAVRAVREGKADFLMKGGIETAAMLKPVVNKETGLSMGKTMTSLSLVQIPGYHKLMLQADGGMLIDPTLAQKRDVIEHGAAVLRALGVEEPKVAVLCAVEKVNPKMKETVDAQALVEMNRSGELAGCRVTGPISYDLIFSREAAEIKGYDCPDCGDFDMILAPDITTGNTLTKSWVFPGGASWGGVIVGAKVPIVLVSRGSSAREKYLALALAAYLSGEEG